MRARTSELEGLLELPSIEDSATRRQVFRQALTSLARSAAVDGPSPLEGIPPQTLARSIEVAIVSGLLDDLDWLSPPAVGVALYELAAALPAGSEKRDVGRRVLARVQEGTAETFAAIATRMARGSRKGISGAALRARIALLFSIPVTTVDAGPLAFAFVSRRELAREWIATASTGSLPARRLAARILERAAIMAARRASQGDDYAPRVFGTEAIARPFARLLADREPLVWRHAAVARGLLAGVAASHWKATIESLHPRLSPTEWRRGAVSLVAAIATAPERAFDRARDLVKSQLAQNDHGLVATMVWGLPRVLDAEPENAEALLDAIVDADAAGAAEGIATVARDISGDTGRRVIATARAILSDRIGSRIEDETELMIARALEQELAGERSNDAPLRDAIERALIAYAEKGARAAHAVGLEALESAKVGLSTLEGLGTGKNAAGGQLLLRTSVLLLRDLDGGLLEESVLDDLLVLGRRPSDEESASAAVEDLHDRLGKWLLAHERNAPERQGSAISMSARRLRALLHLVDAEDSQDELEDGQRTARVRARRIEALGILFARLGEDHRSSLHRTLCAALARALDAMVRESECDPVDVMLITADRLDDAADVATLAEASMDPDVEATLRAYAQFVRIVAQEEPILLVAERDGPPSSSTASARTSEKPATPIASKIESLMELAASLGDDGSGRAEALRAVLMRVGRALSAFANAESRTRIVEGNVAAIESLASAVHAYAQLATGARQRVLGNDEANGPASSIMVAASSKLAALLSRIDAEPDAMRASVNEALEEIRRLLPPPICKLVAEVLGFAMELPHVAIAPSQLPPRRSMVDSEQLPAWLGPRRTIGGFYIVRPLGGGAAASVFVAKRIEERAERDAEQFALKVPDYDGAAARSLSEQEFLDFFRAEASALLGLPADPNLARFVTFDLAARPKPILVMELIEGPTLERFIASAQANAARGTAARAFEILDGILAGLEKMHGHSIGHLDVKPSNVILREGNTPALVDFGLAGRHIRPGCATGAYGAPEVWGVLPDDFQGAPSPLPADVYAFGALAYEVFTGRALFDADTEVAIISKHLVHDGHPPALDVIRNKPLVELLTHTLRRDPRARWSVPQVRAGLRTVARIASNMAWPIAS